MTLYVDPLMPTRRSRRWPYGQACRLAADTPGQLADFAAKLNLSAWWFRTDPRLPHYDLSPEMRALAVRLGAMEVTARELEKRCETPMNPETGTRKAERGDP